MGRSRLIRYGRSVVNDRTERIVSGTIKVESVEVREKVSCAVGARASD